MVGLVYSRTVAYGLTAKGGVALISESNVRTMVSVDFIRSLGRVYLVRVMMSLLTVCSVVYIAWQVICTAH